MRPVRSLLALAVAGPVLALGVTAPAHADTTNHRVCYSTNALGLTANWPVTLTVRGNGTISSVVPGTSYLSGVVPPAVSFVNGSGWTNWSFTNDGHGITVHGFGEVQIGWVTQEWSCQAFWSF